MQARLDFRKASPAGAKAMSELNAFVHKCGLERSLLELVKLRASQINGCAHCIDMHTKELRADGEEEQRLYLLSAWREAPIYTARERSALAWTEAVTLLDRERLTDDLYDEVRAQFDEQDLVDLTLAIVAINGANRLNIAFRTIPGNYGDAVRCPQAQGIYRMAISATAVPTSIVRQPQGSVCRSGGRIGRRSRFVRRTIYCGS
jgi:AhpD family alkylhydroperoxidase